MYERHKLPTELLINLGVSPESAREDACKIKHDLSVESFDAIRRHAKELRTARYILTERLWLR